MYVHANFQDATVNNKKVTRKEALLFYPPSYVGVWLVKLQIAIQYSKLRNTIIIPYTNT